MPLDLDTREATVEEIKVCQMAGRSIGKAWQRREGKPRDALCRKLAYCLCCVCPLSVSIMSYQLYPGGGS